MAPKAKTAAKKKSPAKKKAASSSAGSDVRRGKSATARGMRDGSLASAARNVDPELLLAVSNKMASVPSLDEQLAALVEIAIDATDSDRGTLFLNDSATGELYSHGGIGDQRREIRIVNTTGIAGSVFTTGRGLIVPDAYEDDRFNRAVDEATDYKTNNILAVPIRTVKGEVIGVAQCVNKQGGDYTEEDEIMLEAISMQASVVLQSTLYVLQSERLRQQESEFLDLVADVSSEIQLGPLLQKIMSAVTKMLDSDRSTLFLNDEKTGELYTEIGQGLGAARIRLPNSAGIAGAVFTSGQTINIPYAYADLRFDPSFDKKTGYFTRSILCVPVNNKDGKRIGVTQVLNKRGGPFTDADESRLRAFTAQISIGLENAQLFHDVQSMKDYTDGMLESMSNGVVTFDAKGMIVTCNAAGQRILEPTGGVLIGQISSEYFTGENSWITEQIDEVMETGQAEITMDAEVDCCGEKRSVNVTIQPLRSANQDKGALMLLEDISSEKRVKSTLSRYMDPSLADQLLEGGQEILGGQGREVTMLFSDIRSFTTLTEELGAQGTVSLLNEYLTIMVDCISNEGGVLDKFIGDAIMAVFGAPVSRDDDEDRALRAAIAMMVGLQGYNETRAAHGKKPVDHGIELNTGNVVTGNIGSPKRMDYTVIGDGVNLAARIESACKQYGAKILISEYTLKKLKGTYRTRDVDLMIVKGKTEPVGVFEVLDFHNEDTFPELPKVVNRFHDGIAAYRAGKWKAAIKDFKGVLEIHKTDKASMLYLDRCAELQANPPKDWTGVWTMTSK